MKKKTQLAVTTGIMTALATLAWGQVCEPMIVHTSPAEEGRAWPPLVAGDLLYVTASLPRWAGDRSDLRIYDISDPFLPRERSRLPGAVGGVATTGDLAIIAGGYSEGYLRTVDVSDPDAPRLLGELMLEAGVRDVAAVGSTAYATVGTSGVAEIGLVIVDIADPTSPAVVSILETPGTPLGLAVEGSLVYIGDGDGGLRIIDVTDPAAPMEIASLTTGASTHLIAVAGGLACLSARDGVLLVDVSDPAAPALLASVPYPTRFGIVDVGIDPPLVWFSATESVGRGSLVAVDASDPSSPVIAGALEIGGAEISLALSFALHGSAAYVVSNEIDGIGGVQEFHLRALDISSCAECPPDCDASGSLDFFDFLCFQNLFAARDPAADCDGSGELDLFDFLCFQNQFAAGCP